MAFSLLINGGCKSLTSPQMILQPSPSPPTTTFTTLTAPRIPLRDSSGHHIFAEPILPPPAGSDLPYPPDRKGPETLIFKELFFWMVVPKKSDCKQHETI